MAAAAPLNSDFFGYPLHKRGQHVPPLDPVIMLLFNCVGGCLSQPQLFVPHKA